MDAPEDVEQSAAPPAYHSGVPHFLMPSSFPRTLLRSAVVLLGAACAAPPITPGRAPAPAATVAPQADSLAGPWVLRPSRRERNHSIEISGTLTTRADTAGALERVDTVRVRARTTSSRVVSGDSERFSGLLRAYELSSGDSVPFVAPPGLFLPLPFTAVVGVRGAAPALEIPSGRECSVAAVALQPLRDLWLGAPARISRDQSWSDATTFTICRDSMPLEVSSTRRFRVTGAEILDGQAVLRVVRESRTTIAAEGTQFGETLRIEAEGTGRIEFLVSLAGGEVMRADGESELAMKMTGRRRVQLLRQAVRTTITSP
jgi:hypothetical protein